MNSWSMYEDTGTGFLNPKATTIMDGDFARFNAFGRTVSVLRVNGELYFSFDGSSVYSKVIKP